MSEPASTLIQASAVAIEGRALLFEGEPGVGKSSLARALIDRGARLIGDDGVLLKRIGDQLIALPPPNIAGLVEVRGVGLLEFPTANGAPVSLILTLGEDDTRLPETLENRPILGTSVPVLPFAPGRVAPALRAELALAKHGLAVSYKPET